MIQNRLQPNFDKVDAAIAQGKLWRAKEILQGQIGTFPYDSLLYEKYGGVLLEMGDLLEAGKFLYLSGARKSEYDAAIQVFISRFGKRSWDYLKGNLPSRIRFTPLAQFPASLQEDFRRLGFIERPMPKSAPTRNLWPKRFFAFGLAIFILCGVIGLGTVINFIVSLFRN